MKHSTKTLARVLAKFYLRYSRGNSLINFLLDGFQFTVLGGLGIDLVNRYMPFYLPMRIMIFLFPVLWLTFYTLGYIDEKVGFWKYETYYKSKHINPFFEELDKKIDRINNKLDE